MSLRHRLHALAERALAALAPDVDVTVSHVHVAHGLPDADRDAEFGLIGLACGAGGLYYAWLGESQAGMRAELDPAALRAQGVGGLARLYLEDSDWERSLGLAAISAITDALFRAADYIPPPAPDSLGGLALTQSDVLGLVGYFPPLVRRARALGVETRVVERKAHMVTDEPGLVVSLDPAVLDGCNKIICTGATLLNDSQNEMIARCGHAERLVMLGPTVGFFPDVLFEHGVRAAGGTRILDAAVARARLAAGGKLGDSAVRTLIDVDSYPGFDALLARAADRHDPLTAPAGGRSPDPPPPAAR